MASMARPSPGYGQSRNGGKAIAPDITALIETYKHNSVLSSPTVANEDDDTPTSLSPPPRGPKKSRPRRPAGHPGSLDELSSSLGSISDPWSVVSTGGYSTSSLSHPQRSPSTLSPQLQYWAPESTSPSRIRSVFSVSPTTLCEGQLTPIASRQPILEEHPPTQTSFISGRPITPTPIDPSHFAVLSMTPTPPDTARQSWVLPPEASLSYLDIQPTTSARLSLRSDDLSRLSDQLFYKKPQDPAPASKASRSKVQQILGSEATTRPKAQPQTQPRDKHRPPALHDNQSTPTTAGHDGPSIYVNSTKYTAVRDSFIDLDDPVSPAPSYPYGSFHDDQQLSRHSLSSENSSLRRSSTITSSKLPEFATDAPYQAVLPRRARPVSMLATPTPTAAFFTDPRPAPAPMPVPPPKPTLPLPLPPPKSSTLPLLPLPPQAPAPPPKFRGQLLRKQPLTPTTKVQQLLPETPLTPPPMSNTRAPSERAEMLRKHRKIEQVLGEGVGGMLWPTDDPHARPRNMHRKGVHSADLAHDSGEGQVLDIGPGRRHSSPTSPEGDYARMVRAERGKEHPRLAVLASSVPRRVGSRESFMDMSDEEDADGKGRRAPDGDLLRDFVASPPPPPDERKLKREKLAKLHRFLGSRVPVDLALGPHYGLHFDGLPPPLPVSDGETTPQASGFKAATWRRKRRSSWGSFGAGAEERTKAELDERERVLNVKRAHKMEQMFGTRPPQTLYQKRAAPAATAAPPVPPRPPRPRTPPPPIEDTYASQKGKGKAVRRKRSGTNDSRLGLLADDALSNSNRASAVYMYYRHSLNSLTEIVNQDDMESLAELHEYMHSPGPSDDDKDRDPRLRRMSSRVRRRSLPARTSILSIESVITVTPPLPNPAGFQERRRRAAKLSNFFGVNYRDLFGDVLESIEMGVREEVEVGALNAGEVEELMGKLRGLRIRRNEIRA